MSEIYPNALVDDYVFDPCGYSLNGLAGKDYFTVHVTPEKEFSYASFETSIPIRQLSRHRRAGAIADGPENYYETFADLIERVVSVFEPKSFSTSLFTRNCTVNRFFNIEGGIRNFRLRDRISQYLGNWELLYMHFDRK